MADNKGDFKYQSCYCEENIWHLIQHPKLSGRKVNVAVISNDSKSVTFWNQKSKHEGEAIVWDYHVIAFVEPLKRNAQTVQSEQTTPEEVNIHNIDASWEVWDLDTLLGYPVSVAEYLEESFPYINMPECEFPSEFVATFRLISKEHYLKLLSTDRSHMRILKNANKDKDDNIEETTNNDNNNNDNNNDNNNNDNNNGQEKEENGEELKEWLSPPPSWPLIYQPQLGHNLFTHFINMKNRDPQYGVVVGVHSFVSALFDHQ